MLKIVPKRILRRDPEKSEQNSKKLIEWVPVELCEKYQGIFLRDMQIDFWDFFSIEFQIELWRESEVTSNENY